MADPRDYMLSIGAKLVDEDITKIEDRIKSAAKAMPVFQIKQEGFAELNRSMEASGAATKSLIQIEKELNLQYAEDEKKVASFAQSLAKSSADQSKAASQAAEANKKAADSVSNSWSNTKNSILADMTVMMDAIDKMNAAEVKSASRPQQREANRGGQEFANLNQSLMQGSQESQINDMIARNTAAQEAHKAFSEAIMSTDGAIKSQDLAAEKAAATFERYTPALLKGVEAHRQMNLVLPQGIANVKGFADEFTHMIGQFALWSAGAHLIEGGVGTITKGLTDAVHSEKEQNITGQYYQAQGQDYTPAMSAQAQQSAIDMARVYGEEVIHVQESVGLWGKVTKGELVPALALTDQAMKLNAVSGMNMEEIYRDSVAVMGQMQEPLSRVADLYNIATGLALRYGGGIQTLGGQSDDAVKQMMDGMTRLSSVMVVGLGKGHDTLARIGAEVAIVSHLTNTSGDEVAGHLAAAFAGIEGNGKVIQGLKSIGIEAKNNQNLIEEMGAQMSKVVPIIMGAGVRKQDEEDVLTLLRNYKLVQQATNDARKAMADAALDKSFDSMMKTTEQQLKELRAGWEAVGITVGKEFIPYLQAAANVGNNEVVPWLIANKTEVVDLAKELVQLGLAFGTFSIVKTVVAVAIRAFNELEIATGKVAITQSVSSKAMMMDLTAYQRTVLNTLATTGEADEAMVMSVKLFAAKHNASIDSVILKMIELQETEGKTAGSVIASESVMGNAALELSSKTGIAVATMEGEFAGLATAGEAMSVRIGTAFLKMIPVLGIALTAFEIGKFAIDEMSKSNSVNKNDRYHGAREAHSNQSRDEHFADVMDDKRQIAALEKASPTHTNLLHLGALRSKLAGDTAAFGVEDTYESNSDPKNAPRSAQDMTIKALLDQFARQQAEAEKRLGEIGITNGGPISYEDASKPQSTRGLAGDASQMGARINDIKTKYDGLADTLKGIGKINDEQIAADEKRISIYGNTASAVAALTDRLQAKKNVDQESYDNLSNERGSLQGELASDKKRYKTALSADPDMKKASTVALHDRIDALQNRINAIQPQLDALIADRYKMTDRGNEIKDQQGTDAFNTTFKDLKDDFKAAGTDVTSARTPADAAKAYAAYTQAVKDAELSINSMEASLKTQVNSFGEMTEKAKAQTVALEEYRKTVEAVPASVAEFTAVQQKVEQATQELNLQLHATYDAPLVAAIKGAAAITKEYTADIAAANKIGADTSAIDNWRNLALAINQTTYAQAEYQRKATEFQKQALYTAASGAIDTVGTSVGNSIFNSLNRKPNYSDQENQLQNRINQLNQDKTYLQGAVYTAQRDDIDRQIRALTAQEEQIKTTAAKPASLFTGVIQDIEKSVIGSTLKNAEDNLKKTVTEAFLGPAPKDVATKTMDAANLNKLTAGTIMTAAQLQSQAGKDMLTAAQGGTVAGNGSDKTAASLDTNGKAVIDSTTETKKLTAMMNTVAKSIGSIVGIAGGISAGGISGGLEAAGGVSSLLSGLLKGGAAAGPAGLIASTVIGIGTALMHKDNPALMPDKYATADFGQFGANVQGSFAANGQSFAEDSAISTAAGGLSQGAYIENFIKGKSQAQLTSVFGSEAGSIQQMFGDFQEKGGLTNLHDGNLDVGDLKQVNWQQIQTEATDAFTAITSAANAMNQALAPIISVSAYGKGSNSATFSPYYTPGYGDTSSLSSIPYPSLFAQSPSTAVYNAPPSSGTGNLTTTVNLDGQVIAQTVSTYRSQQVARGFQADS
jgi:hypothetical protein